MKPTNATLNGILASREFYMVDLYQFTLKTGQVLYYSGGQTDITYNGHIWSAGGQLGPYFDRKSSKAKVAWKLGSGTDQLVIDIIPGGALVLGIPWLSAVRGGVFDAADFQLIRGFMTTYGVIQTGCAVLLFQGRVAEIDADRIISTFNINDYRELFSQQLPKNLYAATCANSFGDSSCTASPITESCTVAANTTLTSVVATGPTKVSDFYDQGKITFTSGILNGFAFGISQYIQSSPPTIIPISPLPQLPSIGDTFTIASGCNKILTGDCTTKYANTANFRGFPFTPAPETAL